MNEQALAELATNGMFQRDRASRALGMHLVEVKPGYARMSMTVRPEMINGHGCCHGGYIFMLADSALAFAANSRNGAALAAGASIEFLAPVAQGEVLTAEASEQASTRKTAIVDVRVSNGAGELVALLRGRAHRLNASVTPIESEETE
jgi:acyl-CoA thioesterase